MTPSAAQDLLRSGRSDRVFSAAACEVGTSAGVLFDDVVGTLRWDGTQATPETPFDIASVTKPIVGLLAMALVERGALTLDDTVAQVLPQYARGDKARITARELLMHTSGLPGQVRLYRSATTPDRMWDALARLPLVAPPGRRVIYSSQGFMLLGRMLAAAAGRPLADAVATYVLEPAAMHSTGFGLPAAERDRAAATEDCPWRGRIVQGTVHDENAEALAAPAGHAGLFSTAADLGRLCRTMLRGGAGDAGRLLSDAGVRTMTAPRTNHLELRRCLGWQGRDPAGCPAGDLVGEHSYGHTGFTGTSVWIDPGADLYVVLLANAVHPRRDPPRMAAFRRRFHNLAVATARELVPVANNEDGGS